MEADCWSILALENVNSLAASIALKKSARLRLAVGGHICAVHGLIFVTELLIGAAPPHARPGKMICIVPDRG